MKRIKRIFFENVNLKQTVFKNAFWISLAETVIHFLKFILVILVARYLGATEYGKFSFAFSFVTLFGIFFDSGLSAIITKELAKDKQQESHFAALFSLKLFIGLIVSIFIIVGSLFITPDNVVRRLILLLCIYLFLAELCATFFALFRARQKMEYEAWIKIFSSVLLTALGAALIYKSRFIITLGLAYALSSIFSLVVVYALFHFNFLKLRIFVDKGVWGRFFAMSWPLALISGLTTVYNNTDSVMMGWMGQITATGIYSAVYKIAGIIFIPIGFITQSFYPVLSGFLSNREKLQKSFNLQFNALVLFAMPFLFGGLALSNRLIGLFYGKEFISGVPAFMLLLVSTIIISIYISCNQILIIFDQQKKLFLVFAVGAAMNVVLNYLLIPKLSLFGSSLATVFTHLFVLAALFVLVRRHTFIRIDNSEIVKNTIFCLIASLAMYLLFLFLKINLFLLITSGLFLYLIIYFLLRRLCYSDETKR
jgi:O-antigen/teichoic acid export membrane protein